MDTNRRESFLWIRERSGWEKGIEIGGKNPERMSESDPMRITTRFAALNPEQVTEQKFYVRKSKAIFAALATLSKTTLANLVARDAWNLSLFYSKTCSKTRI